MPTKHRPERLHHYLTPGSDSARWDAFRRRKGDILVCTAAKSGTTWTQMICALLIHQTPVLPAPLSWLSPWLEESLGSAPLEILLADLEAQPYRRVIKTHTPLDGIPYFDDVSYVVCGRDPRDTFLSMLDHMANTDPAVVAEIQRRAGVPPGAKLPEDPNVLFAIWQTTPINEWTPDGFPFGSATYLAASYWAFRHLPNLYFLHYRDLTDDLDGEMRRLAAFLGVAVDETVWPALVEAASFEAMKSRADESAPLAHRSFWVSNADFFRSARARLPSQVLSRRE